MKYYRTIESEDNKQPLHLKDEDFNMDMSKLEEGVDLSKTPIEKKDC